jgi:MFS family permease
MAQREPIFTRSFVLACFASLGAFLSFYLLLATLPTYVERVGGSEAAVGFVLGLFSVSAVLVRPTAGQQSDRLGKRSLMAGGAAVLLLSSALYAGASSVAALSALRLVHGLGWGVFSTASSALVADIVPPARRGEAVGYFGMFGSAAMAFGPALGVQIVRTLDFPLLFAACAASALFATLCGLGLPRPRALPGAAGPMGRRALFSRKALFPSSVLALSALTYASIVSFLPLFAARQGLGNPGVFFTVYAVTLIVLRGPLGKASDRYGRVTVIAPGLVVGALALSVLSVAASVPMLLAAALLYGLFFAAVQPTLMAMAVDRVAPAERGSAMGTFTMAMDIGIGGGSFLWGALVPLAGYQGMYLAAAGVALLALAVLVAGTRAAPLRAPARLA